MDRIFLYRLKDTDDRDCCAYIDNNPMRFECSHYFGRVILQGACYSGCEFPKYNEIETVLTENEYNSLVDFNKGVLDLGFGIDKGSEQYIKGINLCKEIQPIYDRLNSEEAEEFYQQIKDNEDEWLKEEYDLSDEDIEQIFDTYYLDYHDRGCVGCIYDNVEDFGYEEAFSLGYINNKDDIMQRYFDYKSFGEDIVNDSEYAIELDDGRIITLNY